MSSFLTASTAAGHRAGPFRVIALLESLSWAGLLVGMYFKYLGSPRTEIG